MTPGLHYIGDELGPEVWDWDTFMRWLKLWDAADVDIEPLEAT